jgi:hypothetical protein
MTLQNQVHYNENPHINLFKLCPLKKEILYENKNLHNKNMFVTLNKRGLSYILKIIQMLQNSQPSRVGFGSF